MWYRFKYIDGDAVLGDPSSELEFASDAEAIEAADDGIRCMISDRMRQHLPMHPTSVVEVTDMGGRVVHQLAIADLLHQALAERR